MSNNPFGFDIPNLDDTMCDPKEYLETAAVLEKLSGYMRHKAAAIIARKNNKMLIAQHNEYKCEVLYQQLPDWARW